MKQARTARARKRTNAPPPAPAAPAPSVWILDAPRDLGLMVAAPLWIAPLAFGLSALAPGTLGLGAETMERGLNTWLLALGGVGHHLPGMMRAYGDRALFRRFRNRFLIAPLAFGAVCVGLNVAGLHGLLVVAYVWGVWHGLMQTYGFARIYGAKAGAGDRLSARLDFALLCVWFFGVVIISPIRLASLLDNFGACGLPIPGPATMATLRGATWAVIAATTLAWLAFEARAALGGRRSALRIALLASSVGFWWFANVRVRHLLLALPLFELFHDVQYLAIVWAFSRRRAESAPGELRPSLRAILRPTAPALAFYVASVAAYGALSLTPTSGALTDIVGGLVAASQLLHFYYDGFIWKLTERATAQPLGVGAIAATPADILARRATRRHLFTWCAFGAALIGLSVSERRGGLDFRARLPLVAAASPDNAPVQFSEGERRWERGERAAAMDTFRRVLALDPGYVAARRNLALSLAELAERATAAGALEEAARFVDELRALRPGLSGEMAAFADQQLARYPGSR